MNFKQIIKSNRLLSYIAYYFIDKQTEWREVCRGSRLINKGIKLHSNFSVIGKDNLIELERGAVIKNSKIVIKGNNNVILLKSDSLVSGATLWIEDNNCRIEIGKNTFVGPSHLAVTENNSQLIIGDDCMFSSNIQIRTGDSHSIIDEITGQRINQVKSIHIANHCWIGEGAKILKGVSLQENTIVSTGSIVTTSFSGNCLVGGIPAKILKENVNWNKERV